MYQLSGETISLARIALAVICLVVFITVCINYGDGDFEEIDEKFATWVEEATDSGLVTFAKIITYCGNPLTIIIISIILIVLPNRMRVGMPVVFTTLVGLGIQSLIKVIVQRPRPEDAEMFISASGYSFPSGHANSAVIFYLFLMVLLSRLLVMEENRLAANLLRFLMVVFVAMIGLSRVFLRVHYFSDVLAGWVLGATILTTALVLYERIWPNQLQISFTAPEWDAMPRDHMRSRRWRRPVNTSKEPEEPQLLSFPKKRSNWTYPENFKGEKPVEFNDRGGWTYPENFHGERAKEAEPQIPAEEPFELDDIENGDIAQVSEDVLDSDYNKEHGYNEEGKEELVADPMPLDALDDEVQEKSRNPIVRLFETFELIERFMSEFLEKISDKVEGKSIEHLLDFIVDSFRSKKKDEMEDGESEDEYYNEVPDEPKKSSIEMKLERLIEKIRRNLKG